MPQNNNQKTHISTHLYNLIIVVLVIAIIVVMLDRFTDIEWNNFSGAYGYDFAGEGGDHYDADEFEAAIADYDRAIKLDGTNSTLFNNRGVAYNGLGEYDKGLADLNRAIELDSRNAMAYANRCSTYISLNDYIKAMDDCNHSIEINNSKRASMFAYLNRGALYSRLWRYVKASEDYTEAIMLYENAVDDDDGSLADDYARAFYKRGDVLYILGVENYEQAIADYERYGELETLEPYMEERIAEMREALDSR